MEERKPMSGWKMKTGSFMIAIGALIVGSVEVAPMPEIIPWIKFIGFIVGGVGTAFLAWGAGHKMEKNRKVLVKKKTVPYYVHPMGQDEFKLLEAFRKKKDLEPPGAA